MIKWISKPHGNCPVQAEGYFRGYYFYFRARHSQATIEFSKTEEDWVKYNSINRYVLAKVDDPQAGWLRKWICKLLIWKGCLIFMFKGFKQ
jgi:hypothetical protein